MSELLHIESVLKRTAQRRRLQNAWRGFWLGLLGGAWACFLVLGLYKVLPLPFWSVIAAGVVSGACALAGLIIGGWRRPTLLETAYWVDEQKQLKERLSTALELAAASGTGDWKDLLLHDAARHAQALDPRQLLPIRLPRVSRWALLVAALSIGLGFVPEYRSKAYVQKQQDIANVRQTGKQLAELMKHTLVEKPPLLQPTQKAMSDVEQLGEHLAKAPLTRSEALRDLASVTDKIAQQSKDLVQNSALKPLERAAREPGGAGNPSPDDLKRKISDLEKALGKAGANPDKLDKLQKDLEKLKQQAGNMPSKNSAAGAGAREKMEQALSELSQQARDLGASLPGLEEAIKALNSDKTELFLRDLQAAMNDLDKLKQMAKAMQDLQQQAAKLGKDLAEQLEKGQAQAAQSTLRKMIEQLKSGNCPPDQLQKMMAEVSKAVQPGRQYGKVGEHLKNAVQNLQQGQKQEAAQNLADAAQELDKLMQQMADSQSLKDTLDALQRAQACVAMGKSWDELAGTCNACGGRGCAKCLGKPGWGHGGRPGAGVGTWADDEGSSYFNDLTSSYDNSQIQRPDMDPRGLSDRPDDLNPNLAPTKVRGQMSPGGSMPSVTLKGVSIKGTSSVEYEHAATAAQSDAQSALNQDKVPRAYQQTVKEYFDDIKK